MNNIIELRHVEKAYSDNILFSDLNLAISPGDICGIVGVNGSGKSVLLKMICGLAYPDNGEIEVDGEIIKEGKFPQDIGVILDCAGFLPRETGFKNLSIIAGIRKKVSRAEIEDVMRLVGLDPTLKVKVGKYSLGMKQRLAIAQALMEKPKLLILDEPFNAIDGDTLRKFRKLFKELNKSENVTIVMTSHNTEDIQELCNHVYKIEKKGLQILCPSYPTSSYPSAEA